MSEDHEEKENEIVAERPLECGSCKKEITVRYTEIVGQRITATCMCADCPVLERRLKGVPKDEKTHRSKDKGTGLACGDCGTTLEAIRVGNPLGCSHCYEVFDEVIIQELLNSDRIPQRIATTKKTTPIHIGRAPGEAQEINPSLRLLALNEALNETLKREDYEQAAMLRDQIKELTDKTEESNGKE